MWQLEQRVTGGHMGNPEEFLEELFQARHGLLAVRTMGARSAPRSTAGSRRSSRRSRRRPDAGHLEVNGAVVC